MFEGFTAVPWTNFFRKSEDSMTRGHSLKVNKNHSHCNARLQFFSQRVIKKVKKSKVRLYYNAL